MSDTTSSNPFDSDFKLRERHPNFQDYFDKNDSLSEVTRKAFSHNLDVPYGPHALNTIDIFPASNKKGPVFVFIHGGFWRSLDKRSYHFTARPFLENGCAAAHINYRLAPEATMSEIVDDVTEALHWIHQNALEFNGNPNNLHIAGHSAGGHLALAAAIEMEAKGDPVAASLKSTLCISGLFDLDPIRNSYLKEELDFDDATVLNYSPLRREELRCSAPTTFVVGGDETNEFLRQSKAMHDQLISTNQPSSHLVLPGLNHFDIVYELAQSNGLIAKAVFNTILPNET